MFWNNICMWGSILLPFSSDLFRLHPYICSDYIQSKRVTSCVYILYVSPHVKPSYMLTDERSQAVRKSHRWTDCVGHLGHVGFWERIWEPASVAVPRRCQSRPLLHVPLHQRAYYQSGRWERRTRGNFKRALWLLLLRLKECKSLYANRPRQAM